MPLNKPKAVISATNIDDWTIDMVAVAFLRPNPRRFIRAEAKAAKQTWAKHEDLTSRRIINLILQCDDPAQVLRETYDNLQG